MKAQDFRIGNLVYYHIEDPMDERKEWDEVSPIDHDDLRCFVQYEDNSEYRPIPLTEEWLLRFDWFSIDDDRYTFRDIEYYSIGLTGGLYFMGEYTATEIKYVHQLQNLYWCLCGEELTLK